MHSFIRTTSALSLIPRMAEDGGGSAATKPAEAPAQKPAETPKPSDTTARTTVSTPAGQTTQAKTTSPAPGKPTTAPSKPATGKTEAKKPDAKKGATKAKAAEQPKRRESKIAPIQAKVVAFLKGGPKTVQAMAAKFECTELQIRQAIDRARNGDGPEAKIIRTARNTFGYKMPK